MIVSAKGLYRNVYHNDGDPYVPDELLKANDAIIKAGFTNRNYCGRPGEVWAEVFSYKTWEECHKRDNDREDREEWFNRGLEKMEADQAAQAPKPTRMRQLLTRAAAMIW